MVIPCSAEPECEAEMDSRILLTSTSASRPGRRVPARPPPAPTAANRPVLKHYVYLIPMVAFSRRSKVV